MPTVRARAISSMRARASASSLPTWGVRGGPRGSAAGAEQASVRDEERNDEVQRAAHPRGGRRMPSCDYRPLVDEGEHDPHNDRDTDRTAKIARLGTERECLPEGPAPARNGWFVTRGRASRGRAGRRNARHPNSLTVRRVRGDPDPTTPTSVLLVTCPGQPGRDRLATRGAPSSPLGPRDP
jgi:hypothetical protein